MLWIAWQKPPDPLPWSIPEALDWWALRFSPRVCWLDQSLVMEVSRELRLWGGQRALQERFAQPLGGMASLACASSAVGLIALAKLRLRLQQRPMPRRMPQDLPLDLLDAARPHLPFFTQIGVRTWGEAAALPRAGLVRRTGADLRRALDMAWGSIPERYPWLTLPERFDQALELPARADAAPALLAGASRMLSALSLWLRARQLAVFAIDLIWSFDLKRLNGQMLPPHQSVTVRTAEPVQHLEHLRRLLAERLARTRLLAPAVRLRLRSRETAPCRPATQSLLACDQEQDAERAEPFHAFVERLSERLGVGRVLAAEPCADHRPERRTRWLPAAGRSARPTRAPLSPAAALADSLAPAWLLPQPLPLTTHQGEPCLHGHPLIREAGPARLEAGWWDRTAQAALRDYFLARTQAGQWLWIYAERPGSALANDGAAPLETPASLRWFLHGVYG